ncbi:MAG: hypothetical protein DRO46_03780, partial [Candidatus Hecatellales archaeon]
MPAQGRGINLSQSTSALTLGKDSTLKSSVCLCGLDRLGLSLACLLAEAGVNVTLTGQAYLNPPQSFPFNMASEDPLERTLNRLMAKGAINFSSSLKEGVSKAEAVISRVSVKVTPLGLDYSALERFCQEAGIGLQPGSLLIFTGILGLGTLEELVKPLLEERSGLKAGVDFSLAYCPMLPRHEAGLETLKREAFFVAGVNRESFEKASRLLSAISTRIVKVESLKEAEALALLEYAWGKVEQCLAGELAEFCSAVGVNYGRIRRLSGNMPFQPARLNLGSLEPLKVLVEEARRVKVGLRLAEASLKAWERSVKHVVSLLSRLLREKGKSLSKATILVMGVSLNTHFKEVSPAIGQLVSRLKARGAKVLVWDPLYSKGELQRLGFQPASPCEDLPKADCLVVAVGHEILGRLKSRILAE